jgi:hypothetical protein
MDIRTELHNLKRMVLNESHISDNAKEKIANRIFEIEKRVAINYTHCCTELKDKQKQTFDEWIEENKYTQITPNLYKKGLTYYNHESLFKQYKKKHNL